MLGDLGDKYVQRFQVESASFALCEPLCMSQRMKTNMQSMRGQRTVCRVTSALRGPE